MKTSSIPSRPANEKGVAAMPAHHNPAMPVIKFDAHWNVVETNASGIEFLDRIGGFLSEIPPSVLLAHHPCIGDPDCCTDICVTLGTDNYYFSAVAFKEAGYLGLYAFRIVYREAVKAA